MPNSNQGNASSNQQKRFLPKITARIDYLPEDSDSHIKAIASASIANAFAIHGIKVVESKDKGIFVSMPNVSYTQDGEKKYKDQFHAITAEARTALNNAVLKAYEQKIQEDETQAESEDQDESEDGPVLTM